MVELNAHEDYKTSMTYMDTSAPDILIMFSIVAGAAFLMVILTTMKVLVW